MAGLGSETFQKLIDGRITPEKIKNTSKYEDGMENLLYLSEIQKNAQIAITSILPELYIKKLGMLHVDGIKKSMDYILKNQGLIILVAECMAGLGSETFQKLIDGRITPEKIKNASKYEDGMENLLFLSEIQKNAQIAITSILPELYIKKLGMIPVDGIKKSMDYICLLYTSDAADE